jgi:hypothetical protein
LETIKKQDTKLSGSLGSADKEEEEATPEVVPEPPPPPPKVPTPPLEQQLVSGALHREALRAKWEQEEHQLKDKDSIHYQDLLYDGKYTKLLFIWNSLMGNLDVYFLICHIENSAQVF